MSFANRPSVPALVFAFGAKPPTDGMDTILAQAALAHDYRNRLVEIERDRRKLVDGALASLSPELREIERRAVELETALAARREVVSAANARARKRVATDEDRAQIAHIKKTLNAVRDARKIERARLFKLTHVREILKGIDLEIAETRRNARADSGLYWGTYLHVEESMEDAGKGPPPKFKHRTGDIHLAVQVQKGMTWDQACTNAGPNVFRFDRDTSTARVRVDSGPKGKPVWAVLRVSVHRIPPGDSLIKWVHLLRRKVGPHDEWEIQLVLTRASGWAKPDLAPDGQVAVDIGWRVVPEGLRVAYWVGSDGQEGSLVLPARDAGRWAKADSIQSIRDRHFNRTRAGLTKWMSDRSLACLPEWFIDRTASIGQWKSQARLASLVLHWRENRFDRDEVFDTLAWGDRSEHEPGLEGWRKHDKHLWSWEASQRVKAARWRRDTYRVFAAQLSRRYARVILEDINWAALARAPEAEELDSDAQAREYMRIASPGDLSATLRARFRAHALVPAANTTRTCSVCTHVAEFDAAKQIRRDPPCPSCGAVWDQDRNAALNIALASVQS